MNTCIYTYIYIYIYIHTYIHISTYIYIYIYICIYIYININIYIYMHIFIHTHTHTHTHIYIYIYTSYIYIYIYICIFWQHFFIDTNFIKHNRHFMSTCFLLDPFEFLYYFYRIRGELIYVLSIVACIPSTFCSLISLMNKLNV